MASGKSFEGQWLNNHPHGLIREFNPTEDMYIGDYFEGKRHGHGKLTLRNGKTYEGQFKDNMPNGLGKLTEPGVLFYEGTFTPREDRFHIEGKIVYDDGRVVEGTWGGIEEDGLDNAAAEEVTGEEVQAVEAQ